MSEHLIPDEEFFGSWEDRARAAERSLAALNEQVRGDRYEERAERAEQALHAAREALRDLRDGSIGLDRLRLSELHHIAREALQVIDKTLGREG